MGNLTRDPEIKYTKNGKPLAEVGLAVNKKWTDQSGAAHEKVCFIDCVLWNRQAEIAKEYLQKGNLVFFEGELDLDTWETKEGEKRSKLKVIVSNMQLMPNKRAENSAPSSNRPQANGRSVTPAGYGMESKQPVGAYHDDGGVPEDDVPF